MKKEIENLTTSIFEKVPKQYFKNASNKGSLERFNYQMKDRLGIMHQKYALVYLPYGYDHDDKETKYNILYLMHGAMGSPEVWFGGLNARTDLKNILDQMIENDDIEPLIVVTPSYYIHGMQGMDQENQMTDDFQDEFRNYLMPLIEDKYHTFAEDISKANLIASRDHRAFGGYSMGSVTTWHAFVKNLEYIKYFMPMAADSWDYEMMGGLNHGYETAEILVNAVKSRGYMPDDFYIFTSVGDKDFTHQHVEGLVKGLNAFPDTFIFTNDFKYGNIQFEEAPGFYHDYPYGNHFIFRSLKKFFKCKKESIHMDTKVILDMNGVEIKATLNQTESAQALVKKLPYKIGVSRATDDICGVAVGTLPENKDETVNTWKLGEIGWFGGWFTILLDHEEKFTKMPDIMIIGKIDDEDLSKAKALSGSINLTIRKA